jgi:DNA-binding transcriptional LysR family regulator
MSLTLRQLEVFIAAAQDCNFRRTAQRLGVSQPTVSGRIRSIEAYLGYELFDRSSGISPRLTLKGRSFIAKAHELVNGATQLAASPKRPAANTTLRLKIVIGPWLLAHRVMPELPAFCLENPGIVAEFEALGPATEGRELIAVGEADICLYTGDPPPAPGVDIETIATTGCSIFGSPELIARVGGTAAALTAAPFILPPEHHPAARWMRARLGAVGISPSHIVARTQFPDLVMQMMLEGRGFSVFFDEFVRNGALRRVGPPLEPANRCMAIGPRARRPAAVPLLDFLRRVAAPTEELPCR